MKNLFHKTEKPVNHNTKLERKVKKGFRFYAVTVLSMTLIKRGTISRIWRYYFCLLVI